MADGIVLWWKGTKGNVGKWMGMLKVMGFDRGIRAQIDNGLLTSTMKMKRNEIAAKYKESIDALFAAS